MNRYLSGSYAPVSEEVTATDLSVTGRLPEALNGRYLRNGPNPIAPDPDTYHWFTGEGMVHGVRLREGKAEWYRNRWVRTGAVPGLLGVPDPGGPVTDGMDLSPNTNVIGFAGGTFAIVEAGAKPAELTEDLDTIARCDFGGALPNGFSAHPKLDPVTGELHTASYFWGNPNVVEYSVLGPDAALRRFERVPVPGNPMMHDMSITEQYAVFYDLPVTLNVDAALTGARFPYVWDPAYGARLGVLRRNGTGVDDLRWFDVEPCYVFHPLNAHDSVTADGHECVVLDVVRHPRMFDQVRNGPDEGPSSLWRWTIDLTADTVTELQLDDAPVEFPRVDERRVGRPFNVGWAVGLSLQGASVGFDGSRLVRFDLERGAVTTREFGPGHTVGEPVFVPAHADAAEDDGWVLTMVFDPDRGASDLWVLNAADIGADPVAVVHLPARVPLGFHGNWVPTVT
ncbi:MAG: carotenoid oxygenase family protein [Actinomycetes bacterium]